MLADKVKERRKQLGLTQEELGDLIGVKKAAINKYEKGLVVNLKRSTIANLAKALDVDPIWLLGMEEVQENLPQGVIPMSDLQRKHIPLIGSVAAGEPIFDPEFPDVVVDGPLDADFALRVKGDSMEPEYLHGDLIYLRSTPDIPHEGATVAIAIDDEATLKRVYKHTDSVTLISNNPAYAPMVYSFVDHVIRVLGIPIGYTRMFRA